MKNVQNILSHFTKLQDEAGNALSYRIESLGKDNLPMLAKMFAEQPASAFDFFKLMALMINLIKVDKG